MLAFKSIFFYEFIWRKAKVRKCNAFSNLALNRQNQANPHKKYAVNACISICLVYFFVLQ